MGLLMILVSLIIIIEIKCVVIINALLIQAVIIHAVINVCVGKVVNDGMQVELNSKCRNYFNLGKSP